MEKVKDQPRDLDVLEVEYVKRAIQAGVQSTEILQVLVLGRCVEYSLAQLVGAMENVEHIVYKLEPMEIQKLYTFMKVAIKNVANQSLT